MKYAIYSYRITTFNGAAPCYDNGILTLAICKKDMRRVIGNRFESKEQENIWFIGIVGKGLASKSEFKGKADKLLYVAKLDSVMSYGEYYAKEGPFKKCFKDKRRKDMIYIPADQDGEGFEDKKTGKRFIYDFKGANGIHDDKELQNKDWDLKHNNKYVLVSKDFSFLDSIKSEKLTKAIGTDNLCKGVGHKWFEVEGYSKIIKALEDIVSPEKRVITFDLNHKTKCGGCK